MAATPARVDTAYGDALAALRAALAPFNDYSLWAPGEAIMYDRREAASQELHRLMTEATKILERAREEHLNFYAPGAPRGQAARDAVLAWRAGARAAFYKARELCAHLRAMAVLMSIPIIEEPEAVNGLEVLADVAAARHFMRESVAS